MKYNKLQIRSKGWDNGHLKVDFYISTQLAGRIIELIALNEKSPHVLVKLPKPNKKERE
jgi:hypothetical protein